MFRSLLSITLILWGNICAPGQTASIHAVNPGYALKAIHTSIAWNPFATINEYSHTVLCDENGEFRQDIPLTSPRVVQFETGIYQLYMYMEPGFRYEVELPEYLEKKWDEQISPFYQALSMPLTVLSRTSLSTGISIDGSLDVNHAITRFDSLFVLSNTEVLSHRKLGQSLNTDSTIREMEFAFAGDSSIFFSDYRRFRYGILKLNEGKSNIEGLSRDYLGPVVKEWHPGFVELFRALFRDFIYYYTESRGAPDFRNLVNHRQDLQQARQLVRDHPAVWSNTLAEMILLQEFSELFYRAQYHKEAILIMLDSMTTDPVSPRFAIYAQQLRQKLSSLVTGNLPPPLSLEDLDGSPRSLGDFEGKYTYLFFGTTDHYGCMMEYPFLQSYVEKHSAYLNVVSIMVSENREKLKSFMERNGYSWTVMHYEGQPGILKDYMIRAYPTAYLIDRDGKLLLSPATLPSEGFEQQLFRIMRSRGEI
jgi:hypothetical protein